MLFTQYKLTAAVVKGAGYKVVKVVNGAIAAWYPDGVNNEYVADESHSGTPDIYFKETYQNDWAAFGGYFWMSEPTPATEAPTAAPTAAPTEAPTAAPTAAPTQAPTAAPTQPKTTLTLKPNSDWLKDGARFAAYFFIDDNNNKWVSMTAGSNGTYTVEVPTDKAYTKVIFCRMNGSAAENKWDNKWNQTSDLTISDGAGKTYEITGWDNSGKWV